MGFPGSTERYLTQSEVKQRMNAVNQAMIDMRGDVYKRQLEGYSGKAFATGTSQKTYHANSFHCFRGKSDESNEPDNPSIISFTILDVYKRQA